MKRKRTIRLFFREHREVLLYLFFGALTTVISIGSYGALVFTGLDVLAANVVSWIFAVLFAYITNGLWVFEARSGGVRGWLGRMGRFYSGRLATLAMEECILLIFVEILSFPAVSVKVAAQVLVMAANYLISKWVVFRTHG